MKRKSGEYVTQTVTGESYRAYLPAPLPPEPPLELDTGLLQRMDQAIPPWAGWMASAVSGRFPAIS